MGQQPPLVQMHSRTGSVQETQLSAADLGPRVSAESRAAQPSDVQPAGPAMQHLGHAVDYKALSVTELKLGDQVFVWQQAGARHTGISIQESIIER